jgi:hypothetical protein
MKKIIGLRAILSVGEPSKPSLLVKKWGSLEITGKIDGSVFASATHKA